MSPSSPRKLITFDWAMKRLLRNKANFEILEGLINHIYPEYYLIRINNFNRVAASSLDEWVYFLKNEEIKDEFKAKGIQQAKKSFSIMSMTEEEQLAYARYQDDLRYEASLIESNYGLGRMEGKEEGIEIGVEQGIEKGKLEVAKRLVEKGMSAEEAAAVAGIDLELLRH